jgi:hypothetical protein
MLFNSGFVRELNRVSILHDESVVSETAKHTGESLIQNKM